MDMSAIIGLIHFCIMVIGVKGIDPQLIGLPQEVILWSNDQYEQQVPDAIRQQPNVELEREFMDLESFSHGPITSTQNEKLNKVTNNIFNKKNGNPYVDTKDSMVDTLEGPGDISSENIVVIDLDNLVLLGLVVSLTALIGSLSFALGVIFMYMRSGSSQRNQQEILHQESQDDISL